MGSLSSCRKFTFSVLAVLCVGLAAALIGYEEWLPHQRAFEVTVDLTVDNEQMQITRRIRCEGEVRRYHWLGKPVIQWRPTAHSFGERLRSGGAVIVVTPNYCAIANDEYWIVGNELPEVKSHIPYIGWTDNAAIPNIVETYVSPGYFKRSNPRVSYHGTKARIIDVASSKSGSVDSFEWFADGKECELRYGFYTTAITENAWRRIEGATDLVQSIKLLSRLPDDFSLKLSGRSSVDYPIGKLFGGGGIPTNLPNERAFLLNNFYPLFKTADGFTIRQSEQGYFVFYRSSTIRTDAKNGSNISFVVDDQEVVLSTALQRPHAVYDPRSETMYSINLVSFCFPTAPPRK